MKWYAQLIGYGFPVLVGVLLMSNLVERLWDCLIPHSATNPRIRPASWQPRVLAFLESILFIAFLQLGQAWFIGLWLALKVAGQWPRWNFQSNDPSLPPGHMVFNVFMIGNGMLILYVFVGFKLIHWVHNELWLRVFWAPTLIIVLTVAFYIWLGQFRQTVAAPAKP